MCKLPLDIIKNILSYDYRFLIRNGEIIVIEKISKDDTRYILLRSIPIKKYDYANDITKVRLKITKNKNLYINFYGNYEHNRIRNTFIYNLFIYKKFSNIQMRSFYLLSSNAYVLN